MVERESIRRGPEEEDTGIRAPQKIDLAAIVDSAVSEGIELMSEHSRYEPQFLAQYLDKKTLSKYANQMPRVINDYQKKGKSREESVRYAQKSLASFIASGKLLNEKGQRIILRKGLEKKLGRRKSGEVLEGEKYLDRAMTAFKDLYKLMKTGEYAQRMPELAQAVNDIYQIGAFDSAINALYENNLIDDKRYLTIKNALRKGLRSTGDATIKAIDHYFSHALAASILAIIGIGVLASTATLTGNVIGITKTSIIPAITFGALSLILGIYLWISRK